MNYEEKRLCSVEGDYKYKLDIEESPRSLWTDVATGAGIFGMPSSPPVNLNIPSRRFIMIIGEWFAL